MNKLSYLILLLCCTIQHQLFAQTNYPWAVSVPAKVSIADTVGCKKTTYTFTIKNNSNTGARIKSASTGGIGAGLAEITFPAGTTFGTVTGSMNGVAIGAVTVTGSTLSFDVPGAAVTFINTNVTFTIVLNNIFNPPSGTYSFLTNANPALAYIRVKNSTGGWNYNATVVGPYKISSCPPGANCSDYYPVTALPFHQTAFSTCGYGNEYTSSSCGNNPFLGGDDFVFRYTSPGNECVSIILENTAANTGLFVYDNCPSSGGACIATAISATGNPVLNRISLSAPGNYFIVIDNKPTPICTPFDIHIEQETNPINDLPCNATLVNLGTYYGGNNSCSDGSSEPAVPSCWSGGAVNAIWYKVVAPASGQLSVKTALGTILSTQMAVYQGACGSLTMVTNGCNKHLPNCGSFNPTNSGVNLTGLTPGATYYIRIDGENGEIGTFNIIAQDPTQATIGTFGQDCGYDLAIPVCDTLTTIGNSGFQSNGAVCDFQGGGSNCLATGEVGISWHRVEIKGTGNLTFNIIPNDYTAGGSPGAETDYDFAVWKISGTGAVTCAQIQAGSTPLRCNYSALGVTGLFSASNGNAPSPYSGFGGAYNSQINVQPGDVYLIAVSNYVQFAGTSTVGYSIQFGANSPINYNNQPTSPPAKVIWTGAVSSDWFNVKNWGGCFLPTCGISAEIAPVGIQPIINGTGAVCKHITIQSGATLTINTGGELSICGNATNLGSFKSYANSDVIFIQDSLQYVSGNFLSPNYFDNLKVNKGAGSVQINQSITIRRDFRMLTNNSLFKMNGQQIILGGDLSALDVGAGSTLISSTGSLLEFDGYSNTTQRYYNNGRIDKIKISNLNGIIRCQTPMYVGLSNTSGALTFNKGVVKGLVVHYNRTITSVSGQNINSYVDGKLQRFLNPTGSYYFPVGDSVKGYQNINFNFTTPTNADYLVANFTQWGGAEPLSGPLNVTDCGDYYDLAALDNGFWEVNSFNSSGTAINATGTYTATLYNRNFTNPGYKVTVQKKPNTSGAWAITGTCAASTPSIVVRTGMSGFSRFSTAQGDVPTFYINVPDSLCTTSGPVAVAFAPAGGTLTSSGAGLTGNIFDPAAAGPGKHVLTYSAMFAGTPSIAKDSVIVSLTPNATISATGPTTFCAGDSVKLTSGAKIAGIKYTWMLGNFIIADSIRHELIAKYSGVYRLVMRNANCTDTSNAITVTVHPYPDKNLDFDDTLFCAGGSSLLTADTLIAGSTFKWYRNTVLIGGATNYTYTATTTGVYTAMITPPSGCSLTTNPVNIQLIAAPAKSISIIGDTILCPGETTRLKVTKSANYTYTWKKDGTTFIFEDTVSTLLVSNPGVYRVIITNMGTCVDSTRGVTIVAKSNPDLSLTIVPDSIRCFPGKVTMTAVTGYTTYKWLMNGSTIGGAITNSYQAANTGNYSVVITDNVGCTDTSRAVPVVINALPVATISSPDTIFCEGKTMKISTSPLAGATYQWQLNNTNIATATDTFYVTNQSGKYTVIVTDANGCKDTSSVRIVNRKNRPIATISINSDTTLCPYESTQLLTNAGMSSYVWMNSATVLGTVTNTLNLNTAGNYLAIITDANGCKDTTRSVTVSINSMPSMGLTVADTVVCAGQNSVIDATNVSGNTYQWYLNGTLIAGATNQSYTTTAPGNYTVAVTNASMCRDTSRSVTITHVSYPVVPVTTSDTTVCFGQTVTISTPTVSGYTYQWLQNSTPISGEINPQYTATANGNYAVTVTNSENCATTSRNVNVTINPAINVALAISPDTVVCSPNDIQLTATTGYTAYQWLNGTSAIGGATANTYTVTTTGTYGVIITDNFGCKDTTRTVSAKISALPVFGLSIGDTTICPGQTAALVVTGISGVTYQWTKDGTDISGATAVQYNADADGVYTVTVINADGCATTSRGITVDVSNAINTSLNISPDSVVCWPQVVNIQGANSYVSYQWLSNGNLIAGATSSAYTTDTTGIFSVIITDTYGCIDTSRVADVKVHPKPVAFITTTDTTVCLNQPVVLTTGSTPIYAGPQWYFNGTAITDSTEFTLHPVTAGSYYAILSTAEGCKDTTRTVTVSFYSLPVAQLNATGSTVVCSGDSVSLVASGGTTAYQWYLNGSLLSAVSGSQYNTYTPGDYSIIATSADGCFDTSSVLKVQVATYPVVSITSNDSDNKICKGDILQLSTNTASTYTYLWYRNGQLLTTANTLSSIDVPLSGQYTVVVTNEGLCSRSDTTNVVVNELPAVNAGPNGLVCKGQPFVLKGTAQAGSTFVWSAGGQLVTDTTLTPSVAPDSLTEYVLTVTDANGCKASDITQVAVQADVHANIYVNYFSGIVPFTLKFFNSSESADRYEWDFGDGSTSTEFEPTYTYNNVGDYMVTLRAYKGECYDDTIIGPVHAIQLIVPNAISPNGDQVNDKWIIKYLEYFPDNEVEIFNQWGNTVYRTKDYKNDWEGQNVPDGTYYYILKLGNDISPINGYLMIIR